MSHLANRFRFCLRVALLPLLGLGNVSTAHAGRYLKPVKGPEIRQIGKVIPLEISDDVNPLYMRIYFTAGELRNVSAIRILDRTGHREAYRFSREAFASKIQGVSPSTSVVFGKNFTVANPRKQGRRVLAIVAVNKKGRPMRSTVYKVVVKPHPSELLTREASFDLFRDIAMIDHENVCRQERKAIAFSMGEIFIGEEEQEFPSLEHLTKIQVRSSLNGYFKGCMTAYRKCLGGLAGSQKMRMTGFCTEERRKLCEEVFDGECDGRGNRGGRKGGIPKVNPYPDH